tara:strand:+ start:24017 stop:24949 length:933 start_codon:yes stop_codon:yes gene_type:complete
MITYLAKRILHSIPVIWGVLTISFIISYLIPGDPVLALVGDFYDEETLNQLREELGLNQSILTQYFIYLKSTLSGNLGISFQTKSPVSSLILEKLEITFILAFSATLFASIIGIFFGLISAIKFHGTFDRLFILLSLVGISVPVFWVALLLIFFIGVEWKLLPPTGYGSWIFYILPVIALSTRSLAMIARNTRAFMLDILKKDYIRTAKAKGLSKKIILFKHGLKNLLVPIITIIAHDFGNYLSGTVLTESIFGLPGIGRMLLNAIMQRDFPVIQGTILFMALSFVFINIFVDLIYGWINPKIREEFIHG